MTKAPKVFAGLALQTTCRAINGLKNKTAIKEQMGRTIEQLDKLIYGSKLFINSFSGLETKLVVLPEYFLTGFPMGEPIQTWASRACISLDGEECDRLSKVAQDNGVFLSGNAYELDDNFPEIYFQTSFIIAPNGDVILRYRRLISMYSPTPHDLLDRYVELYGDDSLFPVVNTEIGNLAAIASEEILFPELARALTLRGAEIICHSSSEVGSPLLTPKQVARRARAYENMTYIVSANSAGITGIDIPSSSTDGGSMILDYTGKVLAESDTGESMCANAEIDIRALRSARNRPGMVNMLARQRLELFASTYSNKHVYPANNMLDEGSVTIPDRQHFETTMKATIARLLEQDIISP